MPASTSYFPTAPTRSTASRDRPGRRPHRYGCDHRARRPVAAANADTARVPASTFKILTFFTPEPPRRPAGPPDHPRGAPGRCAVPRGRRRLPARCGGLRPASGRGPGRPSHPAEQTVEPSPRERSRPAPCPSTWTPRCSPARASTPVGRRATSSGQITAIHPMALESHTVPGSRPQSDPVRPEDAAVAAQQAFMDALNTAGKRFGPELYPGRAATAPTGATEVGRWSRPLCSSRRGT